MENAPAIPAAPPLPPEIHQIISEAGIHYRLPARDLRSARYMGLFPLAFGLASMALVALWILLIVGTIRFPGLPGAAGPESLSHTWPLLLVAAAAMLIAAVPVLIGVAFFLPNHAEITLADGQLCSREVAGPLHWTFRRPISGITSISPAWNPPAPPLSGDAPAEHTTALIVNGPTFQRNLIAAPGYRWSLLSALAADLRAHCNVTPDNPVSGPAAPSCTATVTVDGD